MPTYAQCEATVVLGWDFAGTLLDATDELPAATRVAGLYPWFTLADGTGTYGEQIVVDPSWITPIPDGVGFPEAATLSLNALTAAQALDLAGLKAGQTLLVTGVSGGVGGFATELAARAGINVIAVASTGDEEFVASLGLLIYLGAGRRHNWSPPYGNGTRTVLTPCSTVPWSARN